MRCRRCAGLVVVNHDEEYCLNCGHRPFLERVMESAIQPVYLDCCPEPGCTIKPKDGNVGCWRHREKIRRQLVEARP